ncbi:HAD superfamily phosphatase (TIGR01681 family)/FkbH-like protein [Mucilaginibacter frigoritolerans]|uniref:HAD superfamily phosphatase (TIGR01681 family)/FkbH-like protein n=1 Tax=Mucilaginibacter frigoritolerans TaxID=652788 RepID=A0A562U788_9SPHI|nr:HAD-IIIC family phosphatase [Mucilaginibacter frigoritolerans]TWJ01710.1 HAD superfamily phosphatase (TIGR01681 family)/FkbH-like protein [Mucilaginibacter frigoritolerans]
MFLFDDFNQLKKKLKRDFSSFKKIKVALLGDTATQFLSMALRATGFDLKLDLDIWEADFNQIESQVFDPCSALYAHNPEVVIIYKSSHKLLEKYNKLSVEHYQNLADEELDVIKSLVVQLNHENNIKIVFYNYAEIDDAVFGNYASKTPSSFLYQLRKLNYELMKYASNNAAFHLVDLSTLQNQYGKEIFFNAQFYINSEMVLSFNILPHVAARTLDLLSALEGKFKKCLILDLDNTLWGGVIGDDGVENIQLGALGIGKAFTAFQYWVKKLKNRGVIIAVCSKNTESVAKEPFEKHSDMVLHLEDIAVFVANWENKADNIRYIQNVLNISFDSMVFLDDNAFERNIVKQNIPELTVPELPEDPSKYLEYLYSLNLFETVSSSHEDVQRTKLYQTEAKRAAIQHQYTNIDDFFKKLEMYSLVEPLNKFNIPRVAQLSQRSNQFNLRTIRYDESELSTLSESEGIFSFIFGLEDKFGDNGLISIVILKKETNDTVFIDTWLMSCRVLKRGMESFVMNTIVEAAKKNGFKHIKGEYIPTAKNAMVKNHYADLGFTTNGDYWMLSIAGYQKKRCFIDKK